MALILATIVMQSMAVLLLEMAYEGKHLKDDKAGVAACIKNLIRWLPVMQAHDPVAARAYSVVWRILKTCAPALQSQANELLAEDPEPIQKRQPTFDNSMKPPRREPWQSSHYAGSQKPDPTTFDPRLLEPQPINPISGAHYDTFPFTTMDQIQMPQAFSYPFVTSFDQGAPVVNMQNLWAPQKTEGLYNMPFFDMNLYQGQDMSYMQNPEIPDMQYNSPPPQYPPPPQ